MKYLVQTVQKLYKKWFKNQSFRNKLIIVLTVFLLLSPLFYEVELAIILYDQQLRQELFLATLKKNPNVQEVVKFETKTDDDNDMVRLLTFYLIPFIVDYDITVKTNDDYYIDFKEVTLSSIYVSGKQNGNYSTFLLHDFIVDSIYRADNPGKKIRLQVIWDEKQRLMFKAPRLQSRGDIEEVLGKPIRGIDGFLEQYKDFIALYEAVAARPTSSPYTIILKDSWGRDIKLTLKLEGYYDYY